MKCTFFGHSDSTWAIEEQLRTTIINLIEEKGVSFFYIGNHGNFDRMALHIVRGLSEKYPIKYYVVLAYLPVKTELYEGYFDNTLLPEGIETVPPKFAILWRNEWMVKNSDYVVTHVINSFGGAAKFKKMAEKQNKKVFIKI